MPRVAAGGASSPMISWTWSWWQQALSVDAPCKFSSMIKSVTLRSHEHQDSGQHQKEHLHGGEWRIEASDQFGGQRARPNWLVVLTQNRANTLECASTCE